MGRDAMPDSVGLLAVPTSCWSWNYDVSRAGDPLCAIRVSWIREAGSFGIDGVRCQIRRERGWGAFVLSGDGDILARARKPSSFFRSFELQCAGSEFVLRAASPFTRRFVLLRRDATVGTVRPVGLFSRAMRADLPRELPVPAQVFILWLVIILWRRAANANAANS